MNNFLERSFIDNEILTGVPRIFAEHHRKDVEALEKFGLFRTTVQATKLFLEEPLSKHEINERVLKMIVEDGRRSDQSQSYKW